ncbi:MAG: hypothetical protein VX641_03460 [Planctomycetota bacterium]|nr:hypothetical protein [Planctomycetota bacterium]
MINHLTTTAVFTASILAAAPAIADIQFHNVLTGAGAHGWAQSGGMQDNDPQQSLGNDFANGMHHALSHAQAGAEAMASCHSASELTREGSTILLWGYASANTYAEGQGIAKVQDAHAGSQLQFTIDRETRIDLRSCRIWESASPLGQSICVLKERHGDILFRHDLLDPQDCREFSVVLEPGTYEVNAHAQLWSTNEGAGSIDEWAEIDVKFALEELTIMGDVDNDGDVDGADLAKFLGSWGYDNPDTDFNGDGTVDGQDLAILLGNWS